MTRAIVVLVGATAMVVMPIAAIAHNAGHVFLPDGRCQELGSFREAPLVGQDRTQLDLIPGPQDQYGVSFVGASHLTAVVLPGGCPAMVTLSAQADESTSTESTSQWVTSGWGGTQR
jgi:hypothetical protein